MHVDPPVIRELHPGTPAAFSAVCRGIGLLLASSLLSQVIVNVGVINLKLLSPDSNAAVTAALLSALILAGVPLFVFASLQAALLPALSRAVASGDFPGYRRQLTRALGVVALLGLAGAVPAILLGPWLVPPLFGVDDVLGRSDFAWLAAGSAVASAGRFLPTTSTAPSLNARRTSSTRPYNSRLPLSMSTIRSHRTCASSMSCVLMITAAPRSRCASKSSPILKCARARLYCEPTSFGSLATTASLIIRDARSSRTAAAASLRASIAPSVPWAATRSRCRSTLVGSLVASASAVAT